MRFLRYSVHDKNQNYYHCYRCYNTKRYRSDIPDEVRRNARENLNPCLSEASWIFIPYFEDLTLLGYLPSIVKRIYFVRNDSRSIPACHASSFRVSRATAVAIQRCQTSPDDRIESRSFLRQIDPPWTPIEYVVLDFVRLRQIFQILHLKEC